MENFFSFIARLFLASIFFIGIILLLNTMLITPNGYAIYQDMLGARGLPGIFAPISIVVQFVFGLTLVLGYKTKLSAYVLSAYSLIWTLVYFFSALSGEPQFIMKSLQYLAITGGFLHLAINSNTSYSLDNFCTAKKKK